MAKEAMLSKGKDGEVAASLRQAAWQLEDVIAEKVCEKYPAEYEARELYFHVIRAQKFYTRALYLMVVLTIFETPTWCDTSQPWEFDDPQLRCLAYGEPTKAFPAGRPIEVMLSGITYLPPGYSIIFEVVILGMLVYSLFQERQLQVRYFRPLLEEEEGKKKEEEEEEAAEKKKKEENQEYYSMKRLNFLTLMIAIELVDCAVFLAIRPKLRVAYLARTAIFCMVPSVIKLYKCISKILVEVATVAVFFIGFLFFFAWVSVMIYNEDPNPPEHFKTFGEAFYGLFIAGICDEFTDILIVSYTRNRVMGVIWFIFLLIVHLLFLSLVLDTLCAGYMKTEEDDKEENLKEKAQGVIRAFELLNVASNMEPHRISKDTFLAFLEEYSRSPGVHAVDPDYASISFDEVDKDSDGKIDENEFTELCVLAQYQMWTTRRDSFLKESFPNFWDNETKMCGICSVKDVRLSVIDDHGAFETFMTWVLTVNFLLVIIETTYDLSDWQEPAWTASLEFFFSFVYLGECMFKIGVTGWDFYSSSTSNIFDFGTTMLLLSTSIFESLLGALSTYANILRLFRLLRVVKQLKNLPTVQFMVSTVVKMVKKAKDMLVLLLVVIFGFTVVGVQFFGGLLYEENKLLEGTDYHENKEYVLNFNDFLMAFGLWFVNLLCEYKPSFAGAIHRVSWGGSWLICPLFWGIAVCVTFELVKAFTIEVYMDLKKKWKPQSKDSEVKHPWPVLAALDKAYDERGKQFWYQCLFVDEEEFEGVLNEVEEMMEEREKEEEGERKGSRGSED